MRPVTISAVLLGVAHVALPAAAAPPAMPAAVLADGGQGVTLARAGASPFLVVPETSSGALLPVGEGGEGGRGRWRRHGGPGVYVTPYWGPPPGYYYAPPPPRYYRPPPPVYYAPPPPVYYAPPPPVFYAPAPGISLNFRF
ncbi:hypothetical protein J5Y09_01910 [Roseomonas sp. PWR1]|uniref:Uncharacterized protein n=1 Tax=Roseomonas nitratireducens TaxID=2820810 RepID=A0ABS4AMR6_9PROT|nr:hypothetical protein [Neoroseomonas nitratireducens]MBP0462654.1 hypothetical protein [Neoroseomonas nitratireducens]